MIKDNCGNVENKNDFFLKLVKFFNLVYNAFLQVFGKKKFRFRCSRNVNIFEIFQKYQNFGNVENEKSKC